jgi:DNA-binding transcriptional ArsR family regulator
MLTDALLEQMAARFKCLGEPMRLKILQVLANGECMVGDLVRRVGTSQK